MKYKKKELKTYNSQLIIKMRFISSLNWIKRGVSQTPTKIKVDQDEMKKIFEEEADKKPEDSDEERPRDDENDEEQDVDKKYNLDDYDQEGNDSMRDRIESSVLNRLYFRV